MTCTSFRTTKMLNIQVTCPNAECVSTAVIGPWCPWVWSCPTFPSKESIIPALLKRKYVGDKQWKKGSVGRLVQSASLGRQVFGRMRSERSLWTVLYSARITLWRHYAYAPIGVYQRSTSYEILYLLHSVLYGKNWKYVCRYLPWRQAVYTVPSSLPTTKLFTSPAKNDILVTATDLDCLSWSSMDSYKWLDEVWQIAKKLPARLMKAGLNNVVLPAFYILVVNNVQFNFDSGLTMFNIFDNYGQCGQLAGSTNIVRPFFTAGA